MAGFSKAREAISGNRQGRPRRPARCGRAFPQAGLLVLGLCLFFCGASPVALAAERTAQDKAVLVAREAFQAGDRARLDGLAGRTAGHPLAPYVDYWRLRLRLEEAEPGEVRDFLARNAGTPLAEQLRRDWLESLGKGRRWDLFLEEYPLLGRRDPEVAAWALQARWYRDGLLEQEGFRALWTAPAALPEAAAALVEPLLVMGRLTAGELRERFRILVRAGLLAEARALADRFPPEQRLPANQIETALRVPARFLVDGEADLESDGGRELTIAAVTRLSRDDPQTAARFWEGPLRERFSGEEQRFLWAIIAVQGARRLLPESLGWFGRAGETPLADDDLAWRVRAALREGNWPEVSAAIGRMSTSGAGDPAWVYWRGRALVAMGRDHEGRALLAWIAREHQFYGLLAAEELGRPLALPPRAAPPTAEELAAVESLAGLRRSLALYRIGLRSEGAREWNWATRGLDDRSLLAAAELARRREIWDRAINTANRTVEAHDFTLRYLSPYRDILTRHARQRNLEEALVLGLVRRESRFIGDARSRAGAQGLMQLMPETARWAAKRSGLKGFQPSQVTRPEINAALGTFYLRHVLDRLGGDTVLAAAAYNAGPARAVRWQGARPLEGAVYVESIPFPETRQYVKKVLTNAVYYAALAGGEGRPLKSRLGTVAAVGGVAAAVNGTNGLEEIP